MAEPKKRVPAFVLTLLAMVSRVIAIAAGLAAQAPTNSHFISRPFPGFMGMLLIAPILTIVSLCIGITCVALLGFRALDKISIKKAYELWGRSNSPVACSLLLWVPIWTLVLPSLQAGFSIVILATGVIHLLLELLGWIIVFKGLGSAKSLSVSEIGADRDASIGQRCGALMIDGFLYVLVGALVIWSSQTWFLSLCSDWLFFLVCVVLNVVLVKKWGGTPGKLILKIKIQKMDGASIGYKEAALRSSVTLLAGFINVVVMTLAKMKMREVDFSSFTAAQRLLEVSKKMPSWHGGILSFLNIWMLANVFTFLFSKRRRALHDFMAGSVVVRS